MPNNNNDHSFFQTKKGEIRSQTQKNMKKKEENFAVAVVRNKRNHHHKRKTIMVVSTVGMRNLIDVILHKEFVDHRLYILHQNKIKCSF